MILFSDFAARTIVPLRSFPLLNLENPSFGRFDFALLDAAQGRVQLRQHGTHFVHAGGNANLLAVVVNQTDRADDRRRAAQAAFREIRHFREIHLALFHRPMQVLFRHDEQAAAGDGGQDGVALGRDQLAVLGDENEVRAAGFLDLVRVAASRYMFSAKPSRCASIIAWRLMA